MPSVSPKQRGAMAAACKGKSRIGIPRRVGCEYMRADRRRSRRRARNPMKYRMMDEPVRSAPRKGRDWGTDLKVIGVLAMIGFGIYYAQRKEFGD